MPSDQLAVFKAALVVGSENEALATCHVDPGPAPHEARKPEIDRLFDQPSVEEILAALDALGLVDGGSIRGSDVRRVLSESRGIPVRVGRLLSPLPLPPG